MGPNVKFVSHICDLIPERKIGVIFFIRKKTIPGGGPRGGLAKDHKKYVFFWDPSLKFSAKSLPMSKHAKNQNSPNEPYNSIDQTTKIQLIQKIPSLYLLTISNDAFRYISLTGHSGI